MAIIAGAGIAAAGALGAAYMSSQASAKAGKMQQTGGSSTQIRDSVADSVDLYQRAAQHEASRDYSYYDGNRIAGFTPDQLAAFDSTRDIAGQGGNIYSTMAGQVANNAANSGLPASRDLAGMAGTVGQGGVGALAGMDNAAATSGALANVGTGVLGQSLPATLSMAKALPQQDLSGYMSPYTRAVLDPALQDMYDRADMDRNRIGASSARNGAFGGSRHAIAQSEAERGVLRETGRMSALANQGAYESALAQLRNDQQIIPGMFDKALNQISQGQQQQRAGIDAQNASLAGRGAVQQQLLGAQGALQNVVNLEGSQLSQTAGLGQANIQRLQSQVNPMLATGGLQQALEQAGYDKTYNDWKEGRDWELRNLDILKNAAATGLGAGSTTSTFGQAPNGASGALGAGVGAFGALGGSQALQNLFKGTGSTTAAPTNAGAFGAQDNPWGATPDTGLMN